jgi:hypothetical protein
VVERKLHFHCKKETGKKSLPGTCPRIAKIIEMRDMGEGRGE